MCQKDEITSPDHKWRSHTPSMPPRQSPITLFSYVNMEKTGRDSMGYSISPWPRWFGLSSLQAGS